MSLRRPRNLSYLLRNLLLLPLFLFVSHPGSAAGPRPAPDGTAPATPSRLSWALEPGILSALSPGARQAVLVANSLAPAPARVPARPRVPEARAAAAAALAAPAPRQNVRVNDPTSRRRPSREPHDVRRRAGLARLRRLRGLDVLGGRLRRLERRRRDVRAHADPGARRHLQLGEPVGRDRPGRRDLLCIPRGGERRPDRRRAREVHGRRRDVLGVLEPLELRRERLRRDGQARGRRRQRRVVAAEGARSTSRGPTTSRTTASRRSSSRAPPTAGPPSCRPRRST